MKLQTSLSGVHGVDVSEGFTYDEALSVVGGNEIQHTTDENMTIFVLEGREAAEANSDKYSKPILNEIIEQHNTEKDEK